MRLPKQARFHFRVGAQLQWPAEQLRLRLNGRQLPAVGSLAACGVKDNDLLEVHRQQSAQSAQAPRQTGALRSGVPGVPAAESQANMASQLQNFFANLT
jgi:hypothetical protein